MDAKIDLSTTEVVALPSTFPIPGVIAGLSAEDKSTLKADPRAYFGDPVARLEIIRPGVIREVDADPCPKVLDGFGWWPVTEVRPALSLGERHAETPTLTVDAQSRTVTAAYAVVSEAAEIAAAFDALETELHGRIKTDAGAKITKAYPMWKQANMTARGVELTRVKAEGVAWSTAEQAEADALDAAWSWVKSIRAASDTAEAAVTAAKGNEVAMRAAATIDWENI